MSDWLQQFVDDGTLGESQLEEARSMAANLGITVEDSLVRLGYLSHEVLGPAQAEHFGHDYINLEGKQIPNSIIELVTESLARENVVIPVDLDGDAVVIAMHNPSNIDVMDKLRFMLNREVRIVMAPMESIQGAINRHYGLTETESVDTMISEFTETQIDFTDVEVSEALLSDEDDNAPIIRLANLIIEEAMQMRASDIHVEPFDDRIRIRYRIDGVLIDRDSPPKRLLAPLVSRFKIMARMDIAEKRRCQDGRIKHRLGNKEFDLRVSILPTNHGQAIVMRILDRDNIKIGIRNLGFGEDNYRIFQNIIRRPNGIFLVTGPTGSGKTTTLYSAIGELNRPDRKIITAEDPVEYYLPGINQVEVRHNIGLDFARIIKSMLRQAPNVILVGEIRDIETGEMAIQASLTGHLVFSTLHTNDAPGAITRLIDMGIQPFLVACSIMAVMAQRLVRVVCPKCREPYQPTLEEVEYFELSSEELEEGDWAHGRGCAACQHTGYRGRKAVFELMTMNSTIREMAFNSEPAQNIRRQARLFGMKSLVDDAKEKALRGITSLSEVYKLSGGS